MNGVRAQNHVAGKRRQDDDQEQCWKVFTHAGRDARRSGLGTENFILSARGTVGEGGPRTDGDARFSLDHTL